MKVRFFVSYTTALLQLSWLQPAVNLTIAKLFKNVSKRFFKVKMIFEIDENVLTDMSIHVLDKCEIRILLLYYFTKLFETWYFFIQI